VSSPFVKGYDFETIADVGNEFARVLLCNKAEEFSHLFGLWLRCFITPICAQCSINLVNELFKHITEGVKSICGIDVSDLFDLGMSLFREFAPREAAEIEGSELYQSALSPLEIAHRLPIVLPELDAMWGERDVAESESTLKKAPVLPIFTQPTVEPKESSESDLAPSSQSAISELDSSTDVEEEALLKAPEGRDSPQSQATPVESASQPVESSADVREYVPQEEQAVNFEPILSQTEASTELTGPSSQTKSLPVPQYPGSPFWPATVPQFTKPQPSQAASVPQLGIATNSLPNVSPQRASLPTRKARSPKTKNSQADPEEPQKKGARQTVLDKFLVTKK
jgi:hypothetical protein